MPQSCSICSHKQRREIEKAIAEGGRENSYRNLATRFDCSTGSLQRHTKGCIPKAVKLVKAAKDELAETKEALTVEAIREGVVEGVRNGTLQTAVTVESVVGRLFDVLLKLLDACDRDLTDPDNPREYNLMPRAQEIEIVWDKNEAAKGEKPRWVKQKSTLQAVLDLAFASEDRRLVRDSPVAHNDRSKVLLDVTDRLGRQAEFLAKLEGRFLPVEKELGAGTTIQLAWIVQILVQEGLWKG